MRIVNVQGGSLTITDSSSGKTGMIKGATSTGDRPTNSNADGKSPLAVGKSKDATVGNLTLTGIKVVSDQYAVNVFGAGKLVLNDAELNAKNKSSIGVNGFDTKADLGSVTVTGGKLSSTYNQAVYWPAKMPLSITGAELEGVAGIEMRGGTAVLNDVKITITKEGAGQIENDGPTTFTIPISLYTTSGGDDAYGNPSLTLEDVDVEVKDGVSVDADLYYGPLVTPAGSTVWTFSEMLNNLSGVNMTKYANLTAKENGKEVLKIASTEANNSSIIIKNGEIMGDALLEKATMMLGGGEALTVPAGSRFTINTSLELKDGAGLVFAEADKSAGKFSFLFAGVNSKIVLGKGSSLEIQDLMWKYSGAAASAANEMVRLTAVNGDVTVTFDKGVVQGYIPEATVTGNGIGKIEGVFPLVYNSGTDTFGKLNIKAKVEGNIMLGSSGTLKPSIEISGNGVYSGKITQANYAWDNAAMSGTAKVGAVTEIANLKAKEGSLGIAAGSLIINGTPVTITGETTSIVITEGTAKVDSKGFTLPAGVTLTVAPGAVLEVEDNAELKIAEGATLKVAGELSTGAGAKVENSGSVVSVNGGSTGSANITGDGKVVEVTEDTDMENISIEGIIKGKENKYDASQIVTIAGNTTMSEDSRLQVNGRLVVPAGVTLTLEPGAELVLANNAVLELEGSIVVKEAYDSKDPKVTVESGKVNVYGSLTVGSVLDVQKGTFVVKQDGELFIQSTGSFTAGTNASVEVEASGTINANGSVGEMTIKNNGTINFDSQAASGDVTVVMGNGAILDVMAITLMSGGKLTVEDVRTDGTEVNAVVNTIEVSATANITGASTGSGYVVAVIKGLKVSEAITSYTPSSGTFRLICSMGLSGDASVSPAYITDGSENDPAMEAAVGIGLSGGSNADGTAGIIISESLAIGENVVLVNDGKLTVTGAIDGTKGGYKADKAVKHTSGYIWVKDSGSIVLKDKIDGETNDDGVWATRYSTGTGSDARVHYVSFDAAMEAASAGVSKEFTLIEWGMMTRSATLPEGVKLDLKDAMLEIYTTEDDDTTLTIAKGASVKNAPSEVWNFGTIYAEDKANVDSAVRDVFYAGSDVYSEQLDDKGRAMRNGWAKWTNVTSALAEAEKGSVVKITDHNLTISSNLTIPEGVTLDSNNQKITVDKNVTLTVNGTLFINQGAGTETLVLQKGTATADKMGAVVLNGQIMSDKEIAVKDSSSDDVVIPGAYYAMTSGGSTMYYATTVDKAAPMLSTAVSQTITIKGDKLTVGDVSFMGKSATEMGTVKSEVGTLTASSITLGNAKLVVADEKVFQGTVKDGNGSVMLYGKGDDVEISSVMTSFNVMSKDGKLTVVGKLDAPSATATERFDVSGTVSAENLTLDYLKVVGTLNLSKTNAIKNIQVDGTLAVQKSSTLTSDMVTVAGTLSAAETGVSVKVLFVGLEKADVIGATATVSGSVAVVDYALVKPGAVVPERISKLKSTSFLLGNEIYLIGYVGASATGYVEFIANINAHVENARFDGWFNAEGKKAVSSGTSGVQAMIGDPGWEQVTAEIAYDVYYIVLKADSGIADVYIDGNLMSYGMVGSSSDAYYAYTAMVKAGSHEISYKLDNGWSGKATLTVNGQKQSGLTFSTAGTPTGSQGYITYDLQLTGIEKSGYVDPVEPEKKVEGLTVTEILLIVLVVLIVIMAVIVALRLTRS